jgi:organic hydroperoxide reductase OsmC/OhrA
MRKHNYTAELKWTGNTGTGTSNYSAYERSFVIESGEFKVRPILGSSEPVFRGDKTRYNPEEMLLHSVSSCHMLWFLHVCSDNGIIVTAYGDHPTGEMTEDETSGIGQFTKITLNPTVHVADESMVEMAIKLHTKAHQKCFIANSLNFPIQIKANVEVG